jgi:dynein heavy chain, axonemal
MKTKDEFLPTPTKSHYTFNLRDMSKVVQGMTMCPLDRIGSDKDYVIMLYLHETFRVFRDRLIDDEDKNKFNETITNVIF